MVKENYRLIFIPTFLRKVGHVFGFRISDFGGEAHPRIPDPRTRAEGESVLREFRRPRAPEPRLSPIQWPQILGLEILSRERQKLVADLHVQIAEHGQ